MTGAKAVARKVLKKAIAGCFILIDRFKEQLTGGNTQIDLSDIKKILIVEMQGFGDALAVLPTAEALREKLSGAKLSFICQKVAADLFRNLSLFDNVMPLGLTKTKLGIEDFIHSIPRLRQEEYDLLIIPSWSMRHTAVSLIVRSKAKLGYLHDYSLRMLYHNDYPVEVRGVASRKEATYFKHEHIVTRALKTTEPLGIENREERYQIELSSQDKTYVSHLLQQHFKIDERQQFVVISPGAVWNGRTWPMEKWTMLLDLLVESNGVKFVLVGSGEERHIYSFLCDGDRRFNLCGHLNVSQLAALIERCVLFIGVDSGPMHLAAALGKPVIALFGPNIPEVSGPKGSLSVVVQKDMDCRPCNQDYCPVPIGKRCMDLINPEEVLNAYHSLMARLGDS